MTKTLLDSCREARKRYNAYRKSKVLTAAKAEEAEAKKKIMDIIDEVNTEIRLTISTIDSLKENADQMGFRAEKRTSLVEIKADISKSNALKRAAVEKQESLEQLYSKKKKLVEKKNDLSF